MPDLEKLVADWRRQMLAAGIRTPVPLEELESHLRDDIERQIQSGTNPQQALENSVQRIGSCKALKTEFLKDHRSPVTRQKLFGYVAVILVGLIVWMSGFTFSFIGFRPGEKVVAYAAVTVSLLVPCCWRYAVPFLPAMPNPRKRTASALLCIALGFIASTLFAQFVLPHFEANRDGQIPAIGFWLLFPIAVGFGLACGIREAVHRQSTKPGNTYHV